MAGSLAELPWRYHLSGGDSFGFTWGLFMCPLLLIVILHESTWRLLHQLFDEGHSHIVAQLPLWIHDDPWPLPEKVLNPLNHQELLRSIAAMKCVEYPKTWLRFSWDIPYKWRFVSGKLIAPWGQFQQAMFDDTGA